MDVVLRVMVADNAPTRFGVRMALDGFALVCGEAGDRAGARAVALAEHPDVCLIGRSLPGGGIEAIREIAGDLPSVSIVVLADSQDVDDLVEAVRAGAIGYLPVEFEPAHLRRAIEAVQSNQAAIPRTMVRELVDEIRSIQGAANGPLTPRETQVLSMLRRGKSTANIAAGLDISPITVRRHISDLVRKAGVAGRADLAHAFPDPDSRLNI